MPAQVLITKTWRQARMKWVMCGLVSSWLRGREITWSWGFSIFFRRGGRVCSRCNYQIVKVDLIHGGDGLILLPDSRDGRQLVLLLMLSVEPSLRCKWDSKAQVMMTKDTWVLNANATKFKVPSHMSEREEQSEAWAGTRDLSRGGSFQGLG